MEITKAGMAGTLESSDALVTVEPGNGKVEFELQSAVINQYGNQIRKVAYETLDRLGIESGLSTHAADYLREAGIHMEDHGWSVNFPNAFHGHDPYGCNPRIGRAAVRFEAERVAHAYKVLKEDQNLLKWLEKKQRGW